MVLALGTSSPDSTIIVETRMSTSPDTKPCITRSSSSAAICPCATSIARPRRERADPRGDGLDRLDPVVHHEHLPAAVDLPGERLLQQTVVPRLDEGQDRRAVPRRRSRSG